MKKEHERIIYNLLLHLHFLSGTLAYGRELFNGKLHSHSLGFSPGVKGQVSKANFILFLSYSHFDYLVLINILHGWQTTEGKIKKENSILLLNSRVAPKADRLQVKAGAVDPIKEVQSGGWGHRVWGCSLVAMKDIPLRAALRRQVIIHFGSVSWSKFESSSLLVSLGRGN